MSKFDDYKDAYKTIRLERTDGILQMTLHSKGESLRWGGLPHRELAHAFHEIGRDRANLVIVLTGTGDVFSGPRPDPATRRDSMPHTPAALDEIMSEGKRLLQNLLDVEVPIIAAVNGPAWRHSELPLMSDIVLAAEEASFQDSGHFTGGLVPGDGVHVVYPILLGLNRARYFLLTGQEIGAAEAKELGLVAEVLPREKLLPRAWEHAQKLAAQPPLMLRYTRSLFTHMLKRQMHDLLGYGLALENLAFLDSLQRD